MAHKDRKTRKMRGSRTHGYGNAQKHRGAGSRGGRGMAGSKKQKWMHISKNFPDYLGKKGFKRAKSLIVTDLTINLSKIELLLDSWVKDGKAKKEAKKYSVNLKELGYDKLLGSGKVVNALNITVDKCSEKARQKVEAASGKVLLLKNESGIHPTDA